MVFFNPNTKVAISALLLALLIASLIRKFFVSYNLLSDKLNSIPFTLFAPVIVAESIHFAVLLRLEL